VGLGATVTVRACGADSLAVLAFAALPHNSLRAFHCVPAASLGQMRQVRSRGLIRAANQTGCDRCALQRPTSAKAHTPARLGLGRWVMAGESA
jgi:hypothetical protein